MKITLAELLKIKDGLEVVRASYMSGVKPTIKEYVGAVTALVSVEYAIKPLLAVEIEVTP